MSPAEIDFWLGRLPHADLPSAVELHEIAEALDSLWLQSVYLVSDGRVYEYGAQLTVTADQHLNLSKITRGSRAGVAIDLQTNRDEVLVGTVHTHPDESGQQGIAFSARDFHFAIDHSWAVNLVHSGKYIFALVRTERTPQSSNPDQVEGEFLGAVAFALAKDFSRAEAIFAANLALAQRYGFGFYYGDSHELRRLI